MLGINLFSLLYSTKTEKSDEICCTSVISRHHHLLHFHVLLFQLLLLLILQGEREREGCRKEENPKNLEVKKHWNYVKHERFSFIFFKFPYALTRKKRSQFFLLKCRRKSACLEWVLISFQRVQKLTCFGGSFWWVHFFECLRSVSFVLRRFSWEISPEVLEIPVFWGKFIILNSGRKTFILWLLNFTLSFFCHVF